MKPITGILKWRLQARARARARAEVEKPPRFINVMGDPDKLGDDYINQLIKDVPGGVMYLTEQPSVEIIRPHVQPSWRHVQRTAR